MANKVRADSYRVDMDMNTSGYVEGVQKATAANESLVGSSKKVDTSQQSTQRTLTQSGRAFTRLASDLDPGLKAQLAMEKGQATLNSALERGKISVSEHAKFLGLLTQKHAPLQQAMTTSRRGMEKWGNSAQLTRFQMLTLQYTINDVAASLASGASPLTILMQQGGQVAQAFGGISGTLRALLTPTRLAAVGFGALALGLGAMVNAANGYESAMRSLEVAVSATGRSAALSREEIEQLIKTTSALSGVSRDEAAQSVRTMVTSRHVGTEMYDKLIQLAGNYAAVIGKDVPTAMTELTNGMKNASAWAEEMHNRFGILTFNQYEHIIALEKSGKAYEAEKIVFDALAEHMANARSEALAPLGEEFSKLGQAWERLTTAFSHSGWVSALAENVAGVVGSLADLFGPLHDVEGRITYISKVVDGKRVALPYMKGSEEFGPEQLFNGTPSADAAGEGRDWAAKRQASEKASREELRDAEEMIRKLAEQAEKRRDAEVSLDSMIEKYKLESEELTLGTREMRIQQEIRKAEPLISQLSIEKQKEYRQAIRDSNGAAWDTLQIIKQQKKEQDEYNQAVESFANRISKNLAEAFLEAKSAADAFKSFYFEILRQLAEKSILNVVVNPLLEATGISGSGAGSSFIGSIFSSIFGGGKASGGSVYPGHSYDVGENGRERFTPSTTGVISPSSSRAPSVAQNFNFNVSVTGPAGGDPKTAASAGQAFALAAEAKIVEIIQRQQSPGGALWGTR